MQSRIPVFNRNAKKNAATRLSVASNLSKKSERKSMIPRKSIIPEQKLSFKQEKVFAIQPTLEAMNERSLPPEVPRSIKKMKISTINIVFQYTKDICAKYFLSTEYQKFFPKQFTKLMELHKNSAVRTIAPQSYPNLELAFSTLNETGKNKKENIIALEDFVILYSTLVITLCNDEAVLICLHFLKKFLRFQLVGRIEELHLLFSALICSNTVNPGIKQYSSLCLAYLVSYDETLENRLAAGTQHKRAQFADLCHRALVHLSSLRSNGQLPVRTLVRPDFAPIPDGIDAKGAAAALKRAAEATESQKTPENPNEFFRSAIIAMQTYETNSSVVAEGCKSLYYAIQNGIDISSALLGEALAISFNTLETGAELEGDEIFDAKDASAALADAIFSKIGPTTLLPAISSAIATTKNIDGLLEKLGDYSSEVSIPRESLAEIAGQVSTFHPEAILPRFLSAHSVVSPPSLEESIRLLDQPETLFEEMERIVGLKDPEFLLQYPSYLCSFLQGAYMLYNREVPQGISESDIERGNEMISIFDSISPEDLMPGGKLGIDVLQAQHSALMN